MIRKPAVSGAFYDSDTDKLRRTVKGFLKEVPKVKALGVIVPHAGYLYSGAVAGKVYSRIEMPKTAVILSPNHTGLGVVGSIMCRGGWETPLGVIRIDEALASTLLKASSHLKEDSKAHLHEHSIEVQLPFVQVVGGEAFVPITLMEVSYAICEEIGLALAKVIGDSDNPVLLVASSDMTHFESSDSAKSKDRLALDRVEAMDPKGLYDVVRSRDISMCGFIPATIMLVAVKALGAKQATVLEYATSGDVSGDYESVVGYAGVMAV